MKHTQIQQNNQQYRYFSVMTTKLRTLRRHLLSVPIRKIHDRVEDLLLIRTPLCRETMVTRDGFLRVSSGDLLPPWRRDETPFAGSGPYDEVHDLRGDIEIDEA